MPEQREIEKKEMPKTRSHLTLNIFFHLARCLSFIL